jgi:hypothetical protein
MTIPLISITVSIFYFAWLWHDRGARDPFQAGSSNLPSKKSTRTSESRVFDLAPVSRVTSRNESDSKNRRAGVPHRISRRTPGRASVPIHAAGPAMPQN